MLTIIAFVILILTLVFIKDTKVKVFDSWDNFVQEESLLLPIWKYIVIVLICLIPVINIIAFIFFMVAYMIKPSYVSCDKKVSLHLKGNNFLTKFLLNIKKKFLNKKI